MMKIPDCICCGKELKNVGGADDKGINQPYEATTFITHGHYGSTVFDPMNPSVWLEINVCDKCLIEKQKQVLHASKLDKSFTVPVSYEPWNRYKHG